MIIVIFKMRRLRLRKTRWPPRVTRLVVGDQDVELSGRQIAKPVLLSS